MGSDEDQILRGFAGRLKKLTSRDFVGLTTFPTSQTDDAVGFTTLFKRPRLFVTLIRTDVDRGGTVAIAVLHARVVGDVAWKHASDAAIAV